MITAPSSLQDLQRRIYTKAKAEPSWRFWGLDVQVCKRETRREAYRMAKENNGAPGIDGVTFDAIEASGVEAFLEPIQDERVTHTYQPLRLRQKAIPQDGGTTVRVLSSPTIRDRVVQGALKLILEPIFEADFQPGSYGYRPKRSAHEAVQRGAEALVKYKTRVLDGDLQASLENVRHHLVLAKVAQRVNDADVRHVLTLILKAAGPQGLPQGGVISPLLRNLYLHEVDRMLEQAQEVTPRGAYTYLESARFAEDLVILVDVHPPHNWLLKAGEKRLREEFAALHGTINEAKSRLVDLAQGDSVGFLGFEVRRIRSRMRKWRAYYPPRLKKRTALLRKLKDIVRRDHSQPIDRVIALITPIVRGWVRYCAIGDASRCFGFLKDWVEKKVRRHLMRARNLRGVGWKRWSRQWLYDHLGLFNHYRVQRPRAKALPA